MTSKNLFFIASIVTTFSICIVALILLPHPIWSMTTIFSLLAFGSSVGFALYSPYSLPHGDSGDNSSQLASIGSLIYILPALILWTGLTFVCALFGGDNITWAMLVIAIAGFIISLLLLHAVSKVIDGNGNEHLNINHISVWRIQVNSLVSIATNSEIKKSLEILSETIQFSAWDLNNNLTATGEKINSAVNELSSKVHQPNVDASDINKQISKISALFEQREHEIKFTQFQNSGS